MWVMVNRKFVSNISFLNEDLKCSILMTGLMQILSLLLLVESLRMDLKFSSLLRVKQSSSLYIVYIGQLFKRLVIRSMLLVSVPS